MAGLSKKVRERFTKQVPTFQKVLIGAKDRDVNESDTVTIVTDILAEVLGFAKYTEITGEHAIRGTFCDLAVQLEGRVRYLIEVKAVGIPLKDAHLRQALNYGANHGVPWVVLTNGVSWQIHRIRFEKPISNDLVCAFEFLDLSARKPSDHNLLYLLSREGLAEAAIEGFHEHAQNVNRYVIGAILQSETVLTTLRRELKRVAPGTRVTVDEITTLLHEVFKREVVEGDAAEHARRRVSRAAARPRRQSRSNAPTVETTPADGGC
jgi:predicted type IV restriction endonuclease